MELDKNQEAINCFNKALGINPDDVAALYNKSCSLAKLKRGKEALEALRKASVIDKNVIKEAKEDKDGQDFIKLFEKHTFSEKLKNRRIGELLQHCYYSSCPLFLGIDV